MCGASQDDYPKLITDSKIEQELDLLTDELNVFTTKMDKIKVKYDKAFKKRVEDLKRKEETKRKEEKKH